MSSATTVLLVPGYTNSGPEHWQSLWERGDPRCRRVEQDDWENPRLDTWVPALDRAVRVCAGPVVLVGHSCGTVTIAHWGAAARADARERAAGALLVAPTDVERGDLPEPLRRLAPMPLARLPFPSIVVASTDDPYVAADRARALADAWGARFELLESAGHVNTAAGFGPWPRGEALLAELCDERRART